MLMILKIAAAAVIAIAVLHPTSTPRVDTCECKAKA
ncbi:MAG: hypothetical protein JWN25_3392 [Verrucomicrobiales bacterium]|nr:hypothetical protein [Verrucomicrobiales bacterium]